MQTEVWRCPVCRLESWGLPGQRCAREGVLLICGNDPELGRHIAHKYTLIKRRERDYLAFHRHLKRLVWLRLIHPQERKLFQRWSRLEHPQLLNIIDSGEAPLYIVRRYSGAPSLEQLLEKEKFELGRALNLGLQLGRLLEEFNGFGLYCEQIHPGRIQIERRAGKELLLMDLCSSFSPSKRYSAPEVLSGAQAGPRSVQYVLALLIYEMIFGPAALKRAQARSEISFKGDLPEYLQNGLQMALSPDPRLRFPNIQSFCKLLEQQPRVSRVQPHRQPRLVQLQPLMTPFPSPSLSPAPTSGLEEVKEHDAEKVERYTLLYSLFWERGWNRNKSLMVLMLMLLFLGGYWFKNLAPKTSEPPSIDQEEVLVWDHWADLKALVEAKRWSPALFALKGSVWSPALEELRSQIQQGFAQAELEKGRAHLQSGELEAAQSIRTMLGRHPFSQAEAQRLSSEIVSAAQIWNMPSKGAPSLLYEELLGEAFQALLEGRRLEALQLLESAEQSFQGPRALQLLCALYEGLDRPKQALKTCRLWQAYGISASSWRHLGLRVEELEEKILKQESTFEPPKEVEDSSPEAIPAVGSAPGALGYPK